MIAYNWSNVFLYFASRKINYFRNVQQNNLKKNNFSGITHNSWLETELLVKRD